METLLLAALFLPLVGALVLAGSREVVRQCALGITALVFVLAAVLVSQFSPGDEAFARTCLPWFGGHGADLGISFDVALDGLSLWLFALTALLMVTAVLVGWQTIRRQASMYYRLLLLLETGMLGVFVARDIVLFYVFFEFTLIPLFFLIGIWGGRQGRRAAMKFILFTLAGSMLTLLGLLAIVWWVHCDPSTTELTFSIPKLTGHLADHPINPQVQTWIFLALFAGFAIRVPLFPLHTWLPLAHVEAPTAASVILAGVLLKVGAYGFVRFSLPMLPDATVACMPYLLWLSVAGIIYGALVALAQSDVKRLIAYGSISQLGFCMLGVFAANPLGIRGGVLQMVSHGLSTGGLLALVGMLYERYGTRKIADLGGLARRVPRLACFMAVMTLCGIGLPGLSGFAGKFLLLVGMFQRGRWTEPSTALVVQYRVIGVLAVAGVVLGAWYMLSMVQRVFFGPVREPKRDSPGKTDQSVLPPPRDLCPREVLALAPLVVLIFWIGLYPRFFLDRMSPTLDKTIEVVRTAEEPKGN